MKTVEERLESLEREIRMLHSPGWSERDDSWCDEILEILGRMNYPRRALAIGRILAAYNSNGSPR